MSSSVTVVDVVTATDRTALGRTTRHSVKAITEATSKSRKIKRRMRSAESKNYGEEMNKSRGEVLFPSANHPRGRLEAIENL